MCSNNSFEQVPDSRQVLVNISICKQLYILKGLRRLNELAPRTKKMELWLTGEINNGYNKLN